MMEEQVNVAAIAAAVKPLIAKLEEKPAKKNGSADSGFVLTSDQFYCIWSICR